MESSTVEADHYRSNLALEYLRFAVYPFRWVNCLKLLIPYFILIFCINRRQYNKFQ